MNKFISIAILFIISSVIGLAQTAIPMSTPTSTATTATTSMATMKPAERVKLDQTNLPKSKQSKNKKAQAKYFEGEVANANDDFKASANAFREAIELDPDFFAAHEAFIKANVFVKMLEESNKLLLPRTEESDGIENQSNASWRRSGI